MVSKAQTRSFIESLPMNITSLEFHLSQKFSLGKLVYFYCYRKLNDLINWIL